MGCDGSGLPVDSPTDGVIIWWDYWDMAETMSYSPLWFQHISIKVNLSLLHGLAYMFLALSDPTISSFSTIFYVY